MMSDNRPRTLSRHIQIESFGQLSDGRESLLFTLTNSNGQTLKVTNYGGIITSLTAADRNGNFPTSCLVTISSNISETLTIWVQ